MCERSARLASQDRSRQLMRRSNQGVAIEVTSAETDLDHGRQSMSCWWNGVEWCQNAGRDQLWAV
jgi:hypothetical protein